MQYPVFPPVELIRPAKRPGTTLVLCILALLACCTGPSQPLSGGETVNERTVTVYLPDGITPASGADVSIVAFRDSSRTAADKLSTDQNGQFAVDSTIAAGIYSVNIVKTARDTLVARQDSVFIGPSSHAVRNDTLETPGSVTGVVALADHHENQLGTVLLSALGTLRSMNINEDGTFRFFTVGAGEYLLKFETTLPDYTPRFVSLEVGAGQDTTLTDTIRLFYSGAPTVRNLSTEYDTINGRVLLSWRPTPYKDFERYVVYRCEYGSARPLDQVIGTADSASFIDTIYACAPSQGQTWYSDTAVFDYEYRVAIRTKDLAEGPVRDVARITTTPPVSLQRSRWRDRSCIPSVSSLSMSPDTLRGTITTRWQNPDPTLIDSFVVIRYHGEATNADTILTADTSIADSVYGNTGPYLFAYTDTTRAVIGYSITPVTIHGIHGHASARCSTTTVPPTVLPPQRWWPFGDIPSPREASVSIDTLHGTILIAPPPTSSDTAVAIRIVREGPGDALRDTVAIDSVFRDTIYGHENALLPYTDSSSLELTYTLQAVTGSGATGPVFQTMVLQTVPPRTLPPDRWQPLSLIPRVPISALRIDTLAGAVEVNWSNRQAPPGSIWVVMRKTSLDPNWRELDRITGSSLLDSVYGSAPEALFGYSDTATTLLSYRVCMIDSNNARGPLGDSLSIRSAPPSATAGDTWKQRAGIPVVPIESLAYDTLSGAVHVHWVLPSHALVDSVIVYRAASENGPFVPSDTVAGTAAFDMVFSTRQPSGIRPDSLIEHHYRLGVLTPYDQVGILSQTRSVMTISPEIFGQLTQVSARCKPKNGSRGICVVDSMLEVSFTWSEIGSFITGVAARSLTSPQATFCSAQVSAPLSSGSQRCLLSLPDTGTHRIVCVFHGRNGHTLPFCEDTLTIRVEPRNFIANAGFEAASGGLPLQWDADAWSSPTEEVGFWRETDGRFGSACVRLEHDGLMDASWFAQEVAGLTPGATARISGYIRTDSVVAEHTVGANINVCDVQNLDLGVRIGNFVGTTDGWRYVEATFTVPADGTVKVRCRLGWDGDLAGGTAWFDELRLTDVTNSVY